VVLFVMLLKLKLGLGLSKVDLGSQSVIIFGLNLKQGRLRLLWGWILSLILLHSEIGLILRNASHYKIDCHIVEFRLTVIYVEVFLLSQDIVVRVKVIYFWVVNNIDWVNRISFQIVWNDVEWNFFLIIFRISLEKEFLESWLLLLWSLCALWTFLWFWYCAILFLLMKLCLKNWFDNWCLWNLNLRYWGFRSWLLNFLCNFWNRSFKRSSLRHIFFHNSFNFFLF
jgi:hypothetical protein